MSGIYLVMRYNTLYVLNYLEWQTNKQEEKTRTPNSLPGEEAYIHKERTKAIKQRGLGLKQD